MEKFGKNTVGTIDSLFGGMEGYMDDINKVSIYYIIHINPLMIDDKPEGLIMYKHDTRRARVYTLSHQP